MGIKCCAKSNVTRPLKELAPDEKEISFPKYSSKYDSVFEPTEKTYNLWRDLQFGEFISILIRFAPDTATVSEEDHPIPLKISHRDPFYSEQLDINFLQSFVENKILKHPLIYTKAGEDEILAASFKDVTLEMYKALLLKLNQHFKEEKANRLTKAHAITYGLLYCTSSNISKIKFFFDLFANERNTLEKSAQMDELLISLFIMASYCTLSGRRKASNNNDKIKPIIKEDLQSIIDAMELKDAQNLLIVFNESFFGSKTELSYDEVKENFSQNAFGWLFNPLGIRAMLEKHNV